VVSKSGKSVHGGNFLSTSHGSSRDEHAGVLSAKRTLSPEVARGIPECLFHIINLI
jgi:hypothetical protein